MTARNEIIITIFASDIDAQTKMLLTTAVVLVNPFNPQCAQLESNRLSKKSVVIETSSLSDSYFSMNLIALTDKAYTFWMIIIIILKKETEIKHVNRFRSIYSKYQDESELLAC